MSQPALLRRHAGSSWCNNPALKNVQFVVKGYGESKPMVPNVDADSMAKNRRVEFKVLNREVLKKESERRRLLQQNEGATPDSTR